jgi:hypothetical protein
LGSVSKEGEYRERNREKARSREESSSTFCTMAKERSQIKSRAGGAEHM